MNTMLTEGQSMPRQPYLLKHIEEVEIETDNVINKVNGILTRLEGTKMPPPVDKLSPSREGLNIVETAQTIIQQRIDRLIRVTALLSEANTKLQVISEILQDL